jgi:hypothetical protein
VSNPHNQFVFVHIPKTAGVSVRALLTEAFGGEAVSPSFSAKPVDPKDAHRLMDHEVISGHISWSDVEKYFPERRCVTFLRNPFDRCLSIYGFFRQLTDRPLIPLARIRGINSPDEAISLARQLPPEDFFASGHPHVLQNIENRMVWQLGHHAAYEERAKLAPAAVLERAISNLRTFAFVGLFERLAEDTSRMLAVMGKPGHGSLVVANKTISPLRPAEMSARARAVVEHLTELDVQLYEAARAFDGRS